MLFKEFAMFSIAVLYLMFLPAAVISQSCSSLVTLSATTTLQYLSSPSYPGYYPADVDCQWTIDAPRDMVVLFIVLDAETENGYDYLQVEDENRKPHRITGEVKEELPFMTSTYKLILSFHSDSSIRFKGFRASYRAVSMCGERLTARSTPGQLTSPGFPGRYGNNVDCFWEISTETEDGVYVELTVEEGATNDGNDYILVREASTQLAKLSGSFVSPTSYTSSTETLFVYFHSDGSRGGRGFRATFRQVTCGRNIAVTGTETRTLTTPGYPTSSGHNLDCNYVLRPEPGKRIQLVITADTEECCDYVDVLEETQTISHLKGSVRDMKITAAAGSTVTLHYVTDGTVNSGGFSVTYQQLEPPKPIEYPRPLLDGHCQAVGDPHFTSFDGKKYDFQGNCAYEFLRYEEGAITDDDKYAPSFLVEISHKRYNRNAKVSLMEQAAVTIGDTKIGLFYGPRLKVNSKDVGTVYNDEKAGFKVFSSSGRLPINIVTSFGLGVKFSVSSLKVTLNRRFSGKVTGLCGNFNGNANDDFPLNPTSNGRNFLAISYANEFNSYTKECDNPAPSAYLPEEQCTKAQKDKFAEDCGLLIDEKNDCFKNCHSLVSPQSFYEECVYDACEYRDSYQAISDSFAAYELKCVEANADILNWREVVGRASPNCPEGSYYDVNAPLCLPTCLQPIPDPLCIGRSPSCVCGDGLILSNKKCVSLSDCGCIVETKYYEQGESFLANNCTERWTCHNGVLQLEKDVNCDYFMKCDTASGKDKCVPKDSKKGYVKGNPFYTTFDGVFYSFDGTGTFILTLTKSIEPESDTWISIEGEVSAFDNLKKPSLTAVIVKLLNGKYVIRMERNNDIKLNGKSIRGHDSKLFTLRPSGRSIILTTKHDVEIAYGMAGQLTVSLPRRYNSEIEGLLGNNNGNKDDDMVDNKGVALTDSNTFARRFQTSEEATYPAPSTCGSEAQIRWENADNCGILNKDDGVFASCHSIIPVRDYFSACVNDLCGSNGNRIVLEKALEVYADDCGRAEVEVCEWRETAGFDNVVCPEHSHYEGCANPCPDSCLDAFASENCDLSGTTEDCICDFGFVKDGNKCIRSSDCGKIDANGTYFVRDDSFLAFAIDISGSMAIEVEAVKSWLSACVADGCGLVPSGGWIISPFNDPGVGPLFGPSTDENATVSALFSLSAEGGGEGGEMGFSGILRALNVIPVENSGCHVYFVSDSPPKDNSVNRAVRQRLSATGCKLTLIFSGYMRLDNLQEDEEGTSLFALKELSETSGGEMFVYTNPNSAESFVGFLDENIHFNVDKPEQETTTAETTTASLDVCPEKSWTRWFNLDLPGGVCDCEHYYDYDYVQQRYPGESCEQPTTMEARKVRDKTPYDPENPNIKIDASGFTCFNRDGYTCDDYEIRLCCPNDTPTGQTTCPDNSWTKWYDRDNSSGYCDCEDFLHLRNENPGEICENPTKLEARKVRSKTPFDPENPNIVANDEGFICWNKNGYHCDDYEIRVCCPAD